KHKHRSAASGRQRTLHPPRFFLRRPIPAGSPARRFASQADSVKSKMQPELLSLPSSLYRTTAFVIVALAIFMVAVHTGIVAIAAQRTSISPKTRTTIPFLVAAFLASWLGVAILVADGANFPIPLESRQGFSGLVALIPIVIALIALFASKNLRAINA